MKPNFHMLLAASYNERGIQGFTNTVTNALDQRKINSIYEPVKNAATGKVTLYLAKRPGVDDSGSTYGTSGQVGYLVHHAPGQFGSVTSVWVFSTSGDDVRASSDATTTVVVTSAGIQPCYVDRTSISDSDTVVVQTRNPTGGAQRAFFSTAIATFTEISDGDFTGLTHRGKIEHMDGFAFIADNAKKAIYNSDINSLANWGALNYIRKQIVQDEVQGLGRLNNQLIAFGSETAEIFRNAGNADGSPLQTVPSLFARIGLEDQIRTGYTHYYATLGGRIYFIGRQGAGVSLGAFTFDGQRFEKVSTIAIDKILAQNSGTNCSVNKVVFSGKQGVAFALDLPTAATQRWLMFFPEWNDWFEWQSTVFTPVNNGEWYIGVGANQHKINRISRATSNWRDAGTDYTWTHQFKVPKEDNATQRLDMFGVKGDTSRSTSNLNVSFSTDDWQTTTAARPIDMTKSQKFITRCGVFDDLGVRLTHTANLDIRIEAAVARIT